jgi:hypothetical protein
MVEDNEPAHRANSGTTDHGHEVVKHQLSSAGQRGENAKFIPIMFSIVAVSVMTLWAAFFVWLGWLVIRAIF